MKTLIMVASGGALGAVLRYLWGLTVYRMTGGPTDLPMAIMGANVLGSFLMGVFVVLAAEKGLTHYAPFVMIGLLGGFTTFSAFSLETVTLLERGAYTHAGIYVLVSVGLSVAGLAAGLGVMRSLLT